MALNADFFISLPLDQYFVDKDTGLPLSNGYLVFKRDSARNILKPVYELNGSPGNYTYVPLPNPLTLSGAGTVINASDISTAIYYYPFDDNGDVDLYYVEAYNAQNVFQWARQAWPNLTSEVSPALNSNFSLVNQITNPQFTNVFLDATPNTLTVSGASNKVFPIGPDWNLIISGTGNVLVQQVAVSGNDQVITSPPYVLDISVSSGITKCLLQQTMNVNSGLWASTTDQTIFLTGMFVAKNQNAGTVSVSMYYVDSDGNTPVLIMSGSINNGGYTLQSGVTTTPIPISADPNSGVEGFTNIYLELVANTHIRISSIQVVPAATATPPQISTYDAQTSNHEQAYQGSWYIPNLNVKRIPSLLIGWDFPLNPRQFGTNHTMAGSAAYIWDQTIGADGAGTATVSNDPISNGFQVTTHSINDAFYIMQYLDGDSVSEILGSPLSVNVNAYTGAVGAGVITQIYLCAGTLSSVFPTLGSSIGTIASNGIFTITQAGWSLIERKGLGNPAFKLSSIDPGDDINLNTDYSFSQWQLPDGNSGNINKFALVITFSYGVPDTVITVNSISLNLGNIPTRPSPQSPDAVLRDCQMFYETSYPIGLLPGNANTENAIVAAMPTISTIIPEGYTRYFMFCNSFTVLFKSIKRSAIYLFSFYNPITGAISAVEGYISTVGSIQHQASIAVSAWDASSYAGKKSISLLGHGREGIDVVVGVLILHILPDLLFIIMLPMLVLA